MRHSFPKRLRLDDKVLLKGKPVDRKKVIIKHTTGGQGDNSRGTFRRSRRTERIQLHAEAVRRKSLCGLRRRRIASESAGTDGTEPGRGTFQLGAERFHRRYKCAALDSKIG